MGELIERKKRILLNEPHSETLSGGLVHFKTDFSGLLEIVRSDPSEYILVCGSNLMDDAVRTTTQQTTTFFIGSTGTYDIFLRPGTYIISIEMLNGEDHTLYVRGSKASSAITVWSKGSGKTSASFTISTVDKYRFNFYDAAGITSANIGHAWLNYGNTAEAYEPYKGYSSASVTGIKSFIGTNNICAFGGTLNVKYWKH